MLNRTTRYKNRKQNIVPNAEPVEPFVILIVCPRCELGYEPVDSIDLADFYRGSSPGRFCVCIRCTAPYFLGPDSAYLPRRLKADNLDGLPDAVVGAICSVVVGDVGAD